MLTGLIFASANMITLQGASAQGYYNDDGRKYADSSYSGYGYNSKYYKDYHDKINKYECRTGSFEGFFVSSPEFCIRETLTVSPLTLMTWNLYLGADLSPIFFATNETELIKQVGLAYNRVLATNFLERADAIADEIQETRPDLIGLQEVSLLRTQSPSDRPLTPATNISFDYLQILIDALAERGLIYEPIVVQTGSDLEAPGLFPLPGLWI